jgi:hypothetical protein
LSPLQLAAVVAEVVDEVGARRRQRAIPVLGARSGLVAAFLGLGGTGSQEQAADDECNG